MLSRASVKQEYYRKVVPAERRVDILLSTDGGFVGDGSNPPDSTNVILTGEYTYRPNKACSLYRLCGKIVSTPKIDIEKYGSNVLTNGILITIKDINNDVMTNFNPKPLLSIDDWSLLLGKSFPEISMSVVSIRWTLTKGSRKLYLRGDVGEYFSIQIQEDLIGIDFQYLQLQGEYE